MFPSLVFVQYEHDGIAYAHDAEHFGSRLLFIHGPLSRYGSRPAAAAAQEEHHGRHG
jgi:hypothetical protein